MTLFWFLVLLGVLFVYGFIQGVNEAKNGESPEKKLMNTRVSGTGVRFGAMVDAMDADARGRSQTKWR